MYTHSSSPKPYRFPRPAQRERDGSFILPLRPITAADASRRGDVQAREEKRERGPPQQNRESQESDALDSGYESACINMSINEPTCYQEPKGQGTTEQPEAQRRLRDQPTMYASSILPHRPEYINDLCKEIHRKVKSALQEHAYDRARAALPRYLPDLINAFSIRIGLEASKPSREYVMQFLHSHCKDIVAELEVLCQDREESFESDHGDADDETTAINRTALWIRRQNEYPELVESKRGFLFSNASMAKYRDVVLSSNSYQWFIESLRKQLSLDWGSDDSTEASSCRLIHDSIMLTIPSGIISQYGTPEIHCARFRITMNPVVWSCLAKRPVADLMTLTSSAPNCVQALSVQDYLDQTWSSGGLKLVKIIQKASGGQYDTDHFDDSTLLTAKLKEMELLVTASGSRYSVSECAEQLAWLFAAFQTIGRQGITSCTSIIENQQENEWLIRYSLDLPPQDVDPSNFRVAPRLRDASMVQGFPTQKRPPLFQGLEIGMECMLDCIGTSWPPVIENGRTVLNGSYHILELVNQTQNVCLWHIVHPGSTACSYPECISRNEHDMPPFRDLLQTEFTGREKRHIVANMEYLGVPVISPGPRISHDAGQSHAWNERPSFEMREEIDPALSSAELKSSAVDSPGESLDSDMLSISTEESDCIKILDPEDNIISTIDQISRRILAEFKESKGFRSISRWVPTERGSSGDSGRSGNPGNSRAQSKSSQTSQWDDTEGHRSRKRNRSNETGDEDRDDGGFRRPPRPAQRPARSPNKQRVRILACPFWKIDGQTHRSCFRMKCSRIADVKYHLSRKHRQPASEYCQRCWIAFENEVHKSAHLSDESGQRCKYNQAARPVGIDNTMAAALHKKSNPKQSTEEKWFAIWDIVFPRHPRPSSPYIDDSLTEDATQLQELIVNRWPSILATELDGSLGLTAWEQMDRLGRKRLIQETLVRLSDEFSAEQARIRAARAAADHQSLGGQTPFSSVRADSAIEMGPSQSNRNSSVGPSNEAWRSTPRTVLSPLETHPPARGQSLAMQDDCDSSILPLGQNIFNVDNGHQQQTQIPPPTTSPGALLPGPLNLQTTEVYGAGHSFGGGLDDLFPRLADDSASQRFLGGTASESDANVAFDSVLSEFDW